MYVYDALGSAPGIQLREELIPEPFPDDTFHADRGMSRHKRLRRRGRAKPGGAALSAISISRPSSRSSTLLA